MSPITSDTLGGQQSAAKSSENHTGICTQPNGEASKQLYLLTIPAQIPCGR